MTLPVAAVLVALQKQPAAEYSPVPEDVWADYSARLKAGPLFKAATELKPADAEKIAEEISGELGMRISVKKNSFIHVLTCPSELGDGAPALYSRPVERPQTVDQLVPNEAYLEGLEGLNSTIRSDGGDGWSLEDLHAADPKKRFGIVISRVRRTEPAKDVHQYAVPPEKLLPFALPAVEEIEVFHPASVPLTSFSVTDQSLAKTVEVLAAQGSLEFAIRSDLATAQRVSLSTRGRSPSEILELIAATTGWQVYFDPDPERPLAEQRGVQRLRPLNARVTPMGLAIVYQARDRLHRPDKPVGTVGDALRLLLRQVAQDLKSERHVVILTAPGAR